MNEPRTLLELYKLLWEQIKDCEIFCLCGRIDFMRNHKIISLYESILLYNDLEKYKPLRIRGVYWWRLTKKGISYRKKLVQRMIKELENDK